ncbi:response regulator [Fusibacter bizertensis]
MKIAAVDDEFHVLERFERMVSDLPELELCGLFETGQQLLSYLENNTLDVVFLDIEMPGVNGLQLAEMIQNLREGIDIIFVTAFSQYAVEAFELEAVDYIMKPLTVERMSKTLNRLLRTKPIVTKTAKPFIQCFGVFEVFVDGQALTWKSSKAKEILAFLVYMRGVPVGWEKIANAIWPEFNAERFQTNFHATTYLLRKRLSESGLSHIFECTRGNYRIVVDKFDCDAYRLEEMIGKNQIKRKEDFQLIEQLLHNGYMEGNGYEWAYSKAARLEALCRDKMENDI